MLSGTLSVVAWEKLECSASRLQLQLFHHCSLIFIENRLQDFFPTRRSTVLLLAVDKNHA
jgi:hypothetical protein